MSGSLAYKRKERGKVIVKKITKIRKIWWSGNEKKVEKILKKVLQSIAECGTL